MPTSPDDERDELGRVPRSRLRHWSTYGTAGEYYADYHGYVPTQVMVGISRAMQEHVLTFAEAYALLLDAGAIIELD